MGISGNQMLPFYQKAASLFHLLPASPTIVDDGGSDPSFVGLSNGKPQFQVPPSYTLTAFEGFHEVGHAYYALLASLEPTRDFLGLYWAYRGFQGTWQDALKNSLAQTEKNARWQLDPNESWAEAFANSVAGTFLGDKSMNWGHVLDPIATRAFFLSLAVPEKEKKMRVLIQLSHHSDLKPNGWSGAPGEAGYVSDLVSRIVSKCNDSGIETVLVSGDLGVVPDDNDALIAQRNPQFKEDYDAFIAPHYEADVHAHQSGAFWGRAAASLTASEDDRLGNLFWAKFKAIPGVPPDAFQWAGVNVTDYYAFRQTTDKTPGVLVEHGVGAPVCNGHGFPHAPDYEWLRDNVDAIATAWVEALEDFGGISVASGGPKVMPSVTPETDFTVLGTRKKDLFAAPTVPALLLKLYNALGAEAGVRPEMAFAQMLKETANWTFLRPDGTPPPSGYDATWNNPAGLGVTGGSGVGNRFVTLEDGVRGHIGHLLWYFLPADAPHVPGFCDRDQRHFGAHKGFANDIRLLDGHWAVPGDTYGESIAALAATFPDFTGDPFWDHADAESLTWGDLKAYNTKLIEYLRGNGLTLK